MLDGRVMLSLFQSPLWLPRIVETEKHVHTLAVVPRTHRGTRGRDSASPRYCSVPLRRQSWVTGGISYAVSPARDAPISTGSSPSRSCQASCNRPA